MEVTMFQGRTDHIIVETGGTKVECWVSLRIKNNGEFTLHTCAGELYELGVKIAAAGLKELACRAARVFIYINGPEDYRSNEFRFLFGFRGAE